MKYIAAYCLLALGGKEKPTEDDLSKFLKSVDCEVSEDELKACVSSLGQKSLHELCNEGSEKLGTVFVGGGGGGAGPSDAKEDKEPEKEPTEEEEEDMSLGGLFG